MTSVKLLFELHPTERGLDKLVYRLIVMFLSTEIFSKRRKIYTWIEEKPELSLSAHLEVMRITSSNSTGTISYFQTEKYAFP